MYSRILCKKKHEIIHFVRGRINAIRVQMMTVMRAWECWIPHPLYKVVCVLYFQSAKKIIANHTLKIRTKVKKISEKRWQQWSSCSRVSFLKSMTYHVNCTWSVIFLFGLHTYIFIHNFNSYFTWELEKATKVATVFSKVKVILYSEERVLLEQELHLEVYRLYLTNAFISIAIFQLNFTS